MPHPTCAPTPVDNADRGGYYATCRNQRGQYAWLAGPFDTHQQAHDALWAARKYVNDHDPQGPWYAYGTARRLDPADRPPGVLNDHLQLEVK